MRNIDDARTILKTLRPAAIVLDIMLDGETSWTFLEDIKKDPATRDIPALVVAGTADPWSDAAVTAEIVASLRRPELVAIDGAGHLPNLEAPARFNEALLAFLGRHAP